MEELQRDGNMKHLKTYKLFESSNNYTIEYGTSYDPDKNGNDYQELPDKISFDEFKEMTADLADICHSSRYDIDDTTDDANGGVLILRKDGVDYASNLQYKLKCKLIDISSIGLTYDSLMGGDFTFDNLYTFSKSLSEVVVKMKTDVDTLTNRLSDIGCPYFISISDWDLHISVHQFRPFTS